MRRLRQWTATLVSAYSDAMLMKRILVMLLGLSLMLAMSLPVVPLLSVAAHAAAMATPVTDEAPPCPHGHEPASATHDPAPPGDVGKAFASAVCQQHCAPAVMPAPALFRSCDAVPLPRPVRQPPMAGTAIDIDTPPPRTVS